MKAVFVLFDSLNRNMLEPYGGTQVETPNFKRLEQRSIKFNQHYVGSMPCMPARRDILTGRLSFLHRSWGPIEPFDLTFTECLQEDGVYSHLITDHYHYWEDGGATYHNRYDSYEFVRGQEGDSWKPVVEPDWGILKNKYHGKQYATERRRQKTGRTFAQDMVNREFIRDEADFPSFQCFSRGLDFLNLNKDAGNWLLQIETFDPHEPFFAPDRFKGPHRTGWNGGVFDWPPYGRVQESDEEVAELRANYFATVSMCDHLLGKVLDYFDQHNLWDDTLLVVTTDHGFLLGEHDFWAKTQMNIYQELGNIPLFIHDPHQPDRDGTAFDQLSQNIDLAPTILKKFGREAPGEMLGRDLLSPDHAARDGVIFGYFGGAVHLATGTHTYHRYPVDIENQTVFQYTLMPTHLSRFFSLEELSEMTSVEPFGFTRGARVMKIPMGRQSPIFNKYGPGSLLERDTRLYDLRQDPRQESPVSDDATERELSDLMATLMARCEAPPEAYERLGL